MVVQEAARVLKPGGKLLVSFSDRWFPTKACGAWAEMHAFERAGFVLDLMLDSGSFRDLETVSYRNWWRPADDRHIGQTRTSDPVFLVQGSRAER
jgi:SAM-dependent methyltransferase